jgi:protoheme IX farnesyltransferase
VDNARHPPQHVGALNIMRVDSVWGQLVKPGIVTGNLIAALGGYFLASNGKVIDAWLLLAVIGGTSLVVASGCVFNNCIDSDIDRKMVRTCHRIMALRVISTRSALCYGGILGCFGLLWLASYSNKMSASLALLGMITYVGFYSLWLKRRSLYGTIVGSIAGAMPPAIGYTAVTGHIDTSCLLLMLSFCLWQMPHAYAIALMRKEDFKAAGLPTLPPARAKRQIVAYVALFFLSVLALGYSINAGIIFFITVIGISAYWLISAILGKSDDRLWARRIFNISIGVILAMSLTLSIDSKSWPLKTDVSDLQRGQPPTSNNRIE